MVDNSEGPSALRGVLLGCEDKNVVLEEQVQQVQKEPGELFMMDLRETINLSFKIINAMENNNHQYLESVSASELTVDKEL
ncbi:hypothetical protein [Paenibacillus harenae]|uniref:hypothetical protein n=1 Tax=Paenibacillus harenae TaxID=306543 RepID=UPI00279480C4|nr:hypothetical protein [Paenibacillus harenae]MDQ0060028.1 hypothetical protein [Paenibacillus harenae]